VDRDRVRRVAGANRRVSLLPSYASHGGVARAARLGRGADASAGGWHDRRGVNHAADRLTRGEAWRSAALGAAGSRQRGKPGCQGRGRRADGSGTGDRALAVAAFPVGRSHNGTHAAAIAAPGGVWLRCAHCCSGRVTCQWLRRWAELRRGEFARRSAGQQAGCAQVPATSSAAWRRARLQARVAQEREHGRDTPVHLLLAGQVQLGEDRVDVLLD
jgi:hypothetical protein